MILLAPSVRIISSGWECVNNNFSAWKTCGYVFHVFVSKPMSVSFRFTKQQPTTKA